MLTSLVKPEFIMQLKDIPVARLRIFLKKPSPSESMRCWGQHLIGQWWGVEHIPQRLHRLTDNSWGCWIAHSLATLIRLFLIHFFFQKKIYIQRLNDTFLLIWSFLPHTHLHIVLLFFSLTLIVLYTKFSWEGRLDSNMYLYTYSIT